MKTDDDSEEAEEPPGNISSEMKEKIRNAREKNDELEWARRHLPGGRIKTTRAGRHKHKTARKTGSRTGG